MDYDEAKARVRERMGPGPQVQPFLVAVYGALSALAACTAFRFFVIPDPDPTMFATIMVSTLSFGVCWLVAWYRHRRYGNAVATEYLKDDDDANRT